MEPYQNKKTGDEIKMSIVDTYITKYDFSVKGKLTNGGMGINVNFNTRFLKPEERKDDILAGIELQVNINLNSQDGEDLGKIDTNASGIFSFEKETQDVDMQKALKVKGASVVYDYIRSYINASTSLSNSLPHIILPLLTFVDKT